ncbi:RNA polymerase I-specific initiation factor-domain-containing protein [Scheffersomyces xylosifermentans]|uniref:RNA polymerase I-specific initiation factor-domain-containing protein n=1 Tax=Scheffersomyces xylosifermentans TaxID=1304137 RepID=UPI00315C96B7
MFEDVVSRKTANSAGNQTLNRLLSKYIEIKKFEEIFEKESLTPSARAKFRKSKYTRKALKVIHKELRVRLKPEETYEIWHGLDNLNSNIDKRRSSNKKSQYEDSPEDFARKVLDKIESSAGDDDEGAQERDEYEDHNSKIHSTLSKFTNEFDRSNHWVKSNFLIRSNGLEVLPTHSSESPEYVQRQHISNLRTLLHLNMLRRNWPVAYKLYCLLIRLPSVDIRALWPIGIEILRRQHEKEGKAESSNKQHTVLDKDDKFFEWLSSFYYITHFNAAYSEGPSRSESAPSWRTGSKTLAPLYVITSLWNLLVKKRFTSLKSKLEELLLVPPYNVDGTCYFLMAMCFLVEAIDVVNGYLKYRWKQEKSGRGTETSSFELDQATASLEKIVEKLEANLKTCDKLKFIYPKSSIEEQIGVLLHYLRIDNNSAFRDDPESESSESEEGDEAHEEANVPMDVSTETNYYNENNYRRASVSYSSWNDNQTELNGSKSDNEDDREYEDHTDAQVRREDSTDVHWGEFDFDFD